MNAYLDSDLLQHLIENNLYDSFKRQAEQKGINLLTTQSIIDELESGNPTKLAELWVELHGLENQIGIVDADAPVIDLPGNTRSNEDFLFDLYKRDQANGIASEIWTHDNRAVNRWSNVDGSIRNNVSTGGDLFGRLLDGDLSPSEIAELRDRAILDPKVRERNNIFNQDNGIDSRPSTINYPTNDDLNVDHYQRSNANGFEYRYIERGADIPNGFRKIGDFPNRPKIDEAKKNWTDPHRDEINRINNDPNLNDGNGNLTAEGRVKQKIAYDLLKKGGGLLTAYDLAITYNEVNGHIENGDYGAALESIEQFAGREAGAWLGGLLGGRTVGTLLTPLLGRILGGAAAGAFAGPIGIIIGAVIGGIAGGIVGQFLVDEDLQERVGDYLNRIFGTSFFRRDPLILDMNFDGVRLSALAGADVISTEAVFFDLDADGFAERTGWVSPNDAFVARDINGDGIINNGNELFGSSTENGFEALAQFDINSDGTINSSDAIYSDLLLWRDLNGDGISQAAELVSLAEGNVVSIDLNFSDASFRRAENDVLALGTFAFANGDVAEAIAVAFNTNQMSTEFVFPDDFQYDPEVFSLPNLRGYGQVPDLWVAMSLDPVLKAMVQDLVTNAATLDYLNDVIGNPFTVQKPGTAGNPGGSTTYHYSAGQFDDVLARWSGVAINEGLKDEVQAEDTVEKFLNRNILSGRGAVNPNFHAAFQTFSAELAMRFYVQLADIAPEKGTLDLIGQIFDETLYQGVNYDAAALQAIADNLSANTTLPISEFVQNLSLLEFDFSRDEITGEIADYIDVELSTLSFDPAQPWADYADWFLERRLLLGVIDSEGTLLDERHRAYTGNKALSILTGPFTEIVGDATDNILIGDAAGAANPDLLRGLEGNDTLQGGAGADTYVFGDNSGQNIVDDISGDRDEVAFQGGLTFGAASLNFADGARRDLLISFDGRSETVLIKNYFTSTGVATIERITFPDGPVVDGEEVRDIVMRAQATEGDDTVAAFPIGSTVYGFGGNDTLSGSSNADTLIGGAGDDMLAGAGGADIYRYSRGDGNDTLTEEINQSTNDILYLHDIKPEDVTIERLGSDARLVIAESGPGEGDEGSVTNKYILDGSSARGVDRMIFDDGTVWTENTLRVKWLESQFTTGDDSVTGFGSADIFNAGKGNDYLAGGGGADIYFYRRGDGDDRIDENINGSTSDKLQLLGINAADVSINRDGTDAVLIISESAVGAGDGGTIRLDETLDGRSARGVEQIVFQDGTTWTDSTLRTMLLDAASTDGDDNIVGFVSNDIIEGGQGDDTMAGAGAADTYIYNRGDGNDVIIEGINQSTSDRLRLVGIDPSEVTIQRQGDDALLVIAESTPGANDGGSILNRYILNGSNGRGVDFIEFDDGTIWNESTLRNFYLRDATTDGNDVITGFGSQDTIVGGKGDDTLVGAGGADTYIYNRGDGNDVITEWINQSTYDKLVLTGIDPNDVVIERQGHHALLVINESLAGAGDGGSILNHHILHGRHGRGVDSVQFDDGTIWSEAIMKSIAWTTGTDGVDNMVGTVGNDRLRAKDGDDTFVGSDGDDFIDGGDGTDTIQYLGNSSAFTFAENEGAFLLTSLSGYTDNLTGIEYIAFDDGTFDINSLLTAAATSGSIPYPSNTTPVAYDSYYMEGTSGSDAMFAASSSNNTNMVALGGNDHLISESTNSSLQGRDGIDVMEIRNLDARVYGDAEGDQYGNVTGPGNTQSADYFVFDIANYVGPTWALNPSEIWATIKDYSDGNDKIAILNGSGGVNGFGDLTISQSGAHVEISTPTIPKIVLENTALADIDASDFIFGDGSAGATQSASVQQSLSPNDHTRTAMNSRLQAPVEGRFLEPDVPHSEVPELNALRAGLNRESSGLGRRELSLEATDKSNIFDYYEMLNKDQNKLTTSSENIKISPTPDVISKETVSVSGSAVNNADAHKIALMTQDMSMFGASSAVTTLKMRDRSTIAMEYFAA